MRRALIVGDSHVDFGHFGKELKRQLEAAGFNVTQAGVGGTSARSWSAPRACTPTKSKCVDVQTLARDWDVVFVSLGTNDAANANRARTTKQSASETAARVDALARRLGGARTVWVLPPVLRGNVKWYTQSAADALYSGSARARRVIRFDSRPFTREVVTKNSGDGVHPGRDVARQWARGAIAAARGGAAWPLWVGAAALGLIALGAGLLLSQK